MGKAVWHIMCALFWGTGTIIWSIWAVQASSGTYDKTTVVVAFMLVAFSLAGSTLSSIIKALEP